MLLDSLYIYVVPQISDDSESLAAEYIEAPPYPLECKTPHKHILTTERASSNAVSTDEMQCEFNSW